MGEDHRWMHRTFHDLRRSYGTVMAHLVPTHELRKLMGHSSITTTMRFYLGVSGIGADKIEEAFATAAG